MHELHLVSGCHDHEPRQTAEVSDVEGAGMGRTIGAHEPRPIHGEPYRQALNGHVVHDLIIGALQEGRIDRGEGFASPGREARSEGHAVLLGDAHIEAAIGNSLANRSSPVPEGMAAVMATILSSFLASLISA